MNLLLHTRKVIINLQNIKDSEAHAKLAGNAFTNSSVTTMESGYPSPSGALVSTICLLGCNGFTIFFGTPKWNKRQGAASTVSGLSKSLCACVNVPVGRSVSRLV